MSGVPFQIPGAALNVAPTMARPVAVGGVPPRDGPRGATGAVAGDTTIVLPSPFIATSRTLSARPTSVNVVVYVAPVAPGTSWQSAPEASHVCHWRATFAAPCHSLLTATVSPSVGVARSSAGA